MKTIKNKIAFFIFLIMLMNKISYSYYVEVIKPNHCPDFFSFIHYPSFVLQVKFNAHTAHPGDYDTILYKIFVEQHGVSIQMDQERIGFADEEINNTINLQNFPELCYNELAVVKIEARNYSDIGAIATERGYFVDYKNGRNCEEYAVTNGTSQLNNSGFCTFFRTCDCCLSSTNYYIHQYKITFTLNRNFTDSIPVVDSTLSLGYNGACPQFQHYWGRKIIQTPTETQFITFVYHVTNILGQDVGWWPCEPQQAAVTFHYHLLI